MFKLLKFIFTAVGVPMIAQQIRNETQNVSNKLLLVTFLADHQKSVVKLVLFGLLGAIFLTSGLSLTLFSIAQHIDFETNSFLTVSMCVSIVILLLGGGLLFAGWAKYKKLENQYYLEIYASHRPKTLVKSLMNSVIDSLIGAQSSHWNSNSKTLN